MEVPFSIESSNLPTEDTTETIAVASDGSVADLGSLEASGDFNDSALVSIAPTPNGQQETLGVVAVSEVFGVTPKSVLRWHRAGKIEASRDEKGRLVFDPAHVSGALIEEKRLSSSGEKPTSLDSAPKNPRATEAKVPADDNQLFLTPSEAITKYDISQGKLRRLAAMGIIRVIRTAGGHRRYLGEDLENYFAVGNSAGVQSLAAEDGELLIGTSEAAYELSIDEPLLRKLADKGLVDCTRSQKGNRQFRYSQIRSLRKKLARRSEKDIAFLTQLGLASLLSD